MCVAALSFDASHACTQGNSSVHVLAADTLAPRLLISECKVSTPAPFAQLLITVGRLSELLILKDLLLFTFWKSKEDVLPLCGAARHALFLFTNYPRFAKKKKRGKKVSLLCLTAWGLISVTLSEDVEPHAAFLS